MLLSDIDTWNVGALQSIAFELGGELTTIRADIAAQGGLLMLSDNGDVTINAPADVHDELAPIADNIEVRAKALIHQATDIDADCAQVFAHLQDGDITARGATDFASAQQTGRDQSGLSTPYPPVGEGVLPDDVVAWWDALSEEEQRKVIAEHPDWIGNRDGVPVWARDEVNKAALERELADAQRAVDEIPTFQEYLRDHGGAGPGAYLRRSEYDRMVADRHDRLSDATALKDAVSMEGKAAKGYDPDKYLMLLEFPEGREARAAVAVGDPDTAEHVGITTPGVDTRATSVPDMVIEAEALRNETINQLELANKRGEDVATIAWLGYEPPGKTDISVLEAGFEGRANAAAPDLAEFYRGINATNDNGSDVHLSAFGHSYGSLTTAQALNELGQTGVVDDAAFYGSPGLGHTNDTVTQYTAQGVPIEVAPAISDESDLYLADRHAYVMSAPGDWISGDPKLGPITLPSAGDFGRFGPNPTTLPLEQLSSGAAVSPADNVSRTGAVTHADYPRLDDDSRLRITGYNLAVIAGGLANVPLENGGERLVR